MSSPGRSCPACSQTVSGKLVAVHTRLVSNATTPFFPPLLLTDTARPDGDGRVKVCTNCQASLQSQWNDHVKAGLSVTERRYWLACCQAVCDVCGQLAFVRQPNDARGIERIRITTTTEGDGNDSAASLPGGSWLSMQSGTVCLEASERGAMACRACHNSLAKQNALFNTVSVPAEQRRYGACLKNTTDESGGCFVCGSKCGKSWDSFKHLQFHQATGKELSGDDKMFFPFLGQLVPAKGAAPATDHSVTVCDVCHDHFVGVWKQESTGRLSRRGTEKPYGLSALSLNRVIAPVQTSSVTSCFLCAKEHQINDLVPAFFQPSPGIHVSPVFPFLTNFSRANSISKFGEDCSASVCMQCMEHLLKEWVDYTRQGTRLCQRRYSIAQVESFSTDADQMTASDGTKVALHQVVVTAGTAPDSVSVSADYSMVIPKNQFCCSICGSARPVGETKVVRVHTECDDGMFFPALSHLQRAPGAGKDKAGTFSCCHFCWKDLVLQWDSFERTQTPPASRSFVIFRGPWSTPLHVDSSGSSNSGNKQQATAQQSLTAVCSRRRKSLQPRKRLWKEAEEEMSVQPGKENSHVRAVNPAKKSRLSSRGKGNANIAPMPEDPSVVAEKEELLMNFQSLGEKQQALQAQAQCAAVQLVAAIEQRGRLATVSNEINSSIQQLQDAFHTIQKVVNELALGPIQQGTMQSAMTVNCNVDDTHDARLISSGGLHHLPAEMLPPIGMQTEVEMV